MSEPLANGVKPQPHSETWGTASLGSVAAIKGGKRLPKGDKFADCRTPYPYIRVTDFEQFSVKLDGIRYLRPETQKFISNYTISKHDVYISIAGTIGLSGMIPRVLHGANLTENAAKIVTSRDLNPCFLMFLLGSPHVQSQIRSQTVKNAQPKLALARIATLEIPIPPLPEQRKIAAVLSLVQRAIEHQDRLLAATTELKETLLQKLFTEGLCGEPQKQTEIGPIPQSWQLTACEDICNLITVGIVVRPASHYVETGVPAFRSLNVRADRLDTTDLVWVSSAANDSVLSKSKLQTGDVLVVRTGYPGTSCVVPDEFDGANCIDIVIARPSDDVVISGFLSRFFNSPAGRAQALANKHGLAQQHLNVAAVKRMLVPVPNPQEQKEIDGVLGLVQARIANTHRKRTALQDLFRTLLHQLMTAQIRVNHLDISEIEKLLDHA
jgi:type I restriction enzyme S subunit